MSTQATAWPEPARERWQPLRIGLVELFHYDQETFHFHDGRLLLRGNNGTGKSKVMALTLPFLFDGELRSSRIEPDGDSGKRMEWNLLLGGRYQERQGYSWLELGRLDAEGQPEYCTLGCGLKAVAGRSVRSRFFLLEGRIGRELELVVNDRALSHERLADALEGRGQYFDRSSAWRRALDERFFGLGEQRYGALITLLLQLRQPQLSRRPNPDMLSRALTEALPPLDPGMLNDVAEAFRNLDAEQDELRALDEAGSAVDEFLEHYRHYAAIAARRRGRSLRTAHSRFEETRAELNRQREALGEAREQRASVETRLAAIQREQRDLGEQERTLRDSETMRSAETLQHAREVARERRASAGRKATDQARSEDECRRLESRLATQQAEAEAAERELVEAMTDLAARAEAARMTTRHERALAAAGWPGGTEVGARLPQGLEAAREHQQQALTLLRDHHDRVAKAEQEWSRIRSRWQDATEERDRQDQERIEAGEQVEAESRALTDAWRHYLDSLEACVPADPEAVINELADWCTTLQGPDPAEAAVEAVRDARQQALHREQARLDDQRAEVEVRIETLEAERLRLEAGEHSPPPPPHWRDPQAREGRPGAPLWQLIEFRDELPSAARGSVEAALEASGLLDAWLCPDGELLAAGTGDAVVAIDTPPAPTGLDQVLRAHIDPAADGMAGLGEALVERILAAIGWGVHAPGEAGPEASGNVWVAEDGRWRLGPLAGAWHKSDASHIGHAARESARRRRLEALAGELDQARGEIRGIATQRTACDRNLDAIEREWQARPGSESLRRAHMVEAERTRALREQEARVAALADALETARVRLDEVRAERDRIAADLGLPADAEALAAIELALAEYGSVTRTLAGLLRADGQARQRLDELRSDRDSARERAELLAEEHAEAEALAADAEVRRDTLESSLGAEVAELEARLGAVATERSRLEALSEEADRERVDLIGRTADLEARVETNSERLETEDRARAEAIDELVRFEAEGLLRVGIPQPPEPPPEVPWAAEAAVRFARRIEQQLGAVDDDDASWERHQRTLHHHFTSLASALGRHGHEATAEQRGELMLVRIVFQARRSDPAELAVSLRDEIRERRSLLDQKERDLLETYLIDEVASHLQQLVTDAERRARTINDELGQRPTSTGMKLRLRWRPLEDGEQVGGDTAPAGFHQARERLLRQTSAAWSRQDREAVGEFLQARIQEMRADDEGGSMLEVLERALDYRRWHRFDVERWQDGRWRPAYGPASGGERALVITLPLFAATASHYGSARTDAPRLVMLDEVFAGIDDDARSKCMGLLAQFDLDVLMTSEREWGCYPEVPGLGIAQLIRREGIDAVLVSRWRWDGRRRTPDDQAPPADVLPEPEDAEGTLF